MLPKWHILSGLILILILIFLFNLTIIQSLIIFLASVLIDVDHYAYYVYRERNFSLRKAYKKFISLDKKFFSMPKNKRNKYDYSNCILHGIEPLFIVFSLAFIFNLNFLFLIFLGMLYHHIFDLAKKIYGKESPLALLSTIYRINYKKTRKDMWDMA